ncbi:MAG: PH domain-containing protein [Deltaproteobacteria bacterium]|nr:MAG: PH domain-containing protein [Deltaproteobacteria bacterium]
MVINIMFPPSVSLPVSITALIFVLLALAWIRKFHGSIHYDFTEGKVTRYCGVLFGKTISIPCNQVHRISARRGAFQRLFGISTVDMLTTDPGAHSGSRVMLSVNGVEKPEELEKMVDSCRTGKV